MRYSTLAGAVLVGALSSLAACGDQQPLAPAAGGEARLAGMPNAAGDRVAVVETGADGQPELYVQAPDGSGRRRIRFPRVVDEVAGNSPLVEYNDRTIRSIGPLRWSPDGQSLAAVVGVGLDQSAVVVVGADGRNARVVSNNGQIIMSNVDWSPDGRFVAYGMSTLGARQVDVFVSDVQAASYTRLTVGENLMVPAVRFSQDGSRVFFSRYAGSSFDGVVANPVHDVAAVGVAGGAPVVVASKLLGQVDGISRVGTTTLLSRAVVLADGTEGRSVVLADAAAATESAVTAGGDVRFGALLNLESLVLVTGWSGEQAVYSADGTPQQVLGGIARGTAIVDAWYAPIR